MPLKNIYHFHKYGINSIKYQSISAWNMFINKFHNLDIPETSYNKPPPPPPDSKRPPKVSAFVEGC